MSTRSSWRAIAREWFWALTCYSLLIAPFGCELRTGGSLQDGIGAALDYGLFINEDTDDPLLIAARNSNGDAFFVFGTRDANGNLEEIESISVLTAEGEESFITFELGRPVHIQGPDGSYAHITYTEVSAERLTAGVELYNAATTEKETFQIDIDLEQTAAQIAELVRAATGQEDEGFGPAVLVARTGRHNERTDPRREQDGAAGPTDALSPRLMPDHGEDDEHRQRGGPAVTPAVDAEFEESQQEAREQCPAGVSRHRQSEVEDGRVVFGSDGCQLGHQTQHDPPEHDEHPRDQDRATVLGGVGWLVGRGFG